MTSNSPSRLVFGLAARVALAWGAMAFGGVARAQEQVGSQVELLVFPNQVDVWPNRPTEIRVAVYSRAFRIGVLNPFFRADKPFFGTIQIGRAREISELTNPEMLRRSDPRAKVAFSKRDYQMIHCDNIVGATFHLVIKGSSVDVATDAGPQRLRIPREAGTYILKVFLDRHVVDLNLREDEPQPRQGGRVWTNGKTR